MSDAQAPVLEMLWEDDDPRVALERRFGFSDVASAARWVSTTVSEHWGIGVGSCERIAISDRNALAWVTTASSTRLLAKWSVAPSRYPRLSQIARLTAWLADAGLPVSAPMRSSGGGLQVEVDGVSMCLQRLIPGDLLDVEDPDQVRAAGAALGRLHQALAGYPAADRFVPPDGPPRPLAVRITDWLGSAGEHVPEAGRHALRTLIADAPDDRLRRQLLHGDFRSSNVLCTGGRVAAVLDLEEARVDHCIDEVARSAVMLGTRFRDWGPVSAEVRATFLSGYRSERSLTPAEERWWEILVLWYALLLVPHGEDPTGWRSSALSHAAQLT